jgi:hypothetical protein
MSAPRKHHYLPQFYLEAFKVDPQSGSKPHIWQIEKGPTRHTTARQLVILAAYAIIIH